jgi:CysZ protein
MKNNHTGMHYLLEGLRLTRQPGLRRYVAIPLLVSTTVFAGAIFGLTHWLEMLIDIMLGYLPSWLDWLRYLLWPLFAIAGVLIIFYTFSLITNLIAPVAGRPWQKTSSRALSPSCASCCISSSAQYPLASCS